MTPEQHELLDRHMAAAQRTYAMLLEYRMGDLTHGSHQFTDKAVDALTHGEGVIDNGVGNTLAALTLTARLMVRDYPGTTVDYDFITANTNEAAASGLAFATGVGFSRLALDHDDDAPAEAMDFVNGTLQAFGTTPEELLKLVGGIIGTALSVYCRYMYLARRHLHH